MKAKPLNAYWASELAPNESTDDVLDPHIRSTDVPTLDAAVSDQQAVALEQYRLEKTPAPFFTYPYEPHHLITEQIAEIRYFLTCSGVLDERSA